jgi:hypothetical protein
VTQLVDEGVQVIRPFDLRDVGLVMRLQRQGTPLDLEARLTRSRSPLSAALIARGLGFGNGVSTCIIDHKEDSGHWLALAQMQQLPGRPDYVITFLAPALTAGSGVHALWQRVLAHLCVVAGERGGQRLYAGLPQDGEEYQIFRHTGFTAYAQEEVLRWTPSEGQPEVEPLPLRRQHERDSWRLQQLYATITPRVVQNAEGSAQGEWELSQRVWLAGSRRQGFVWESHGDIAAAVQIRSGPHAHWLRLLLHPDLIERADALVAAALARTRRRPKQELYCAVRTYESGIAPALGAFGFRAIGTQTLVVKCIAALVREPVAQALPALNGTVERAIRLKCQTWEYGEEGMCLDPLIRRGE